MKPQIWASVWKISPFVQGNPTPVHTRKAAENSQWQLQKSTSQAGAAIYSPYTYHALLLFFGVLFKKLFIVSKKIFADS